MWQTPRCETDRGYFTYAYSNAHSTHADSTNDYCGTRQFFAKVDFRVVSDGANRLGDGCTYCRDRSWDQAWDLAWDRYRMAGI